MRAAKGVTTVIAIALATIASFGWTYVAPASVHADADSSIFISVFGSGAGTVTDNKSDPAFQIDCHYANGTQTGICSGGYTAYPNGVDVVLTFSPAKGSYACLEGGCGAVDQAWQDDIPLSPGDSFTVKPDFEISVPTLHVTGSGTGTGRVFVPGTDAVCPTCALPETYGATLDLHAIADPGSVFIRWTGPCVADGASCLFVITGDTTIDARFDLLAAATPTPAPRPLPTATQARPTKPSLTPTPAPPSVTASPSAIVPAGNGIGSPAPGVPTRPPVIPAGTQSGAEQPVTYQRDDRPIYLILSFVAVGTVALIFQLARKRLPPG